MKKKIIKRDIVYKVFSKVKKLLNEPTDLWSGVSNIEVEESEDYIEINYLTQQGSTSQWKKIKFKK